MFIVIESVGVKEKDKNLLRFLIFDSNEDNKTHEYQVLGIAHLHRLIIIGHGEPSSLNCVLRSA